MNSIENTSELAAESTEEGWVPLSALHLFPWILLLTELLRDVVLALLPYAFHGIQFISWGFALMRWGLGLAAFGLVLQERRQGLWSQTRQVALGLAATGLILRIGLALISQIGVHTGLNAFSLWMVIHGSLVLMELGALILLVKEREPDSGGRFDAAVVCMVVAGDLNWLCLPVLAIAAVKGHPLLAALWQTLRQPSSATQGGWFDAQDDSLRLRNLGGCALACAVMFLLLLGQTLFSLGRFYSFGHPSWWGLADAFGLILTSMVLAVHVLKHAERVEGRKGRGLAIAALITNGLPLLLLVIGLAVLVVIFRNGVHF